MNDTINIVEDDELITVENMTNVQVGYILPTSNVTRRFIPKVKMKIAASELRELSYQSGGLDLLQNYLRVNNEELAAEFGVSADSFENEYNWTEADVDNCLLNAELDVLLDALDFAPEGIVEALKNRAVELEISDNQKLKAIGEKTNSDLSVIIKNKHAYDNVSASDGTSEKKATTRRTTKKTTTTTRRTAVKKAEDTESTAATKKTTTRKSTAAKKTTEAAE